MSAMTQRTSTDDDLRERPWSPRAASEHFDQEVGGELLGRYLLGYEQLAESTIRTYGTKKQKADFSSGHRKPSVEEEVEGTAPIGRLGGQHHPSKRK